MIEELRSYQHLDEALRRGSQDGQEPVHVLLDLSFVLARCVARQLLLRRCQVVREDGWAAHKLAILINNHWDGSARVLGKVGQLLVLALKYVDLVKPVFDTTDVEQGDDSACVIIKVISIDLQLLLWD